MMAQVKEQSYEIKEKLEAANLTAEVEKGLVKATVNGNKVVKDIWIDESLAGDTESISDLCVAALNKAMKMAEELHEKEMGALAKDFLPGFKI